jgi:hypothetical protein
MNILQLTGNLLIYLIRCHLHKLIICILLVIQSYVILLIIKDTIN